MSSQAFPFHFLPKGQRGLLGGGLVVLELHGFDPTVDQHFPPELEFQWQQPANDSHFSFLNPWSWHTASPPVFFSGLWLSSAMPF